MMIVNFLRRAFGFYKEELPGSNFRRFLGRLTILLTLGLLVDLWFCFSAGFKIISVRSLLCWGIFYFLMVVIIPVLFLTNRTFKLNAHRLVLDVFISSAFSVLVFALVYRKLGFEVTASAEMVFRPVADSVYFSAVTFSTLGFGDFRPQDPARGYAAVQGLWGNIHLGVLAGAVFFVLDQARTPSGRDTRYNHRRRGRYSGRSRKRGRF